MSENEEEYCGFVCSDVVEKAKEIRKELDDFAKYNPEEADVVLGNVLRALGVEIVYPAKAEEFRTDKGAQTFEGSGDSRWHLFKDE